MILQTNIQKERPLHRDSSSVNQVFIKITITPRNFFNMNCDAVDYSTAHILSHFVTGLSIFIVLIVWISLALLQRPLLFTGASVQSHSDSINVLWRTHRWRLETFPLQHWIIIIKLVIKFMKCFEWRCPLHLKMGMKPHLCYHSTSCFSKEQHCFYALFYRQSSFVSQLV
jgi:hypothetical protein